MNRYLALAPAFVPRSYVLRVLGVLMLFMGGLFAPVIHAIANKPPDWFAEYMAVMVIFGVSSSCGMVLRRVRSWTPSVLISELWPRICIFAAAMLVLLWLTYLAIMFLTDGLAGIAPTVGFAAAMFTLMSSAGVLRRLAVGAGLTLLAIMLVHPLRGVVIEALQTSAATWVLLMVAIGSFIALLRLGAMPVNQDDLKVANILWGNPFEKSRINKAQRMSWLPLRRMTRQAAFAAAFEHSRLQAWINDSLWVVLALAMSFVVWLIGARDIDAVVMIVSAMSALLATLLPIINRSVIMNIGDFIWLAGSHDSKRKLVFAMFFRLLCAPVRTCIVALAVSLFILGFSNDSDMARFSISLLLCAPGGAAVMLALGFILGRQLEAGTGLSIVVFSAVMSMTMIISIVGVVAGLALNPVVMVVLTMLGSAVVALAASLVTARWIAGRRAWLN